MTETELNNRLSDIYERLIALEHHVHSAPDLSTMTSQPIAQKDLKQSQEVK